MRAVLLALLPFVALGTPAQQEDDKLIIDLQERLYQREDVRNYCTTYPSGTYWVEVIVRGEPVTFPVRCNAWHSWMAVNTQKQ